MRTGNEIMQAAKDGSPATEEELRYALHNVALWHSQYMFDIARAITEDPMSAKTKRGLQRAWDSWKERNSVDLDKWLRGSSFEPGISREEFVNRASKSTVDAAMKFVEALSSQPHKGE